MASTINIDGNDHQHPHEHPQLQKEQQHQSCNGKQALENLNNSAIHNQTTMTTGAKADAPINKDVAKSIKICSLGAGLWDDFKRRRKYYISDYIDGVCGDKSLSKTISTTLFLYFSVLAPCIAFGVVNTNNTHGIIGPRKTMICQAIGGMFFAFFSGQPLIVVMTTAPLCICVKVVYMISEDLEIDFLDFYACVGLWMAFFLAIFSITNLSNLMRFCTRSTEDIFAIFTAFAFGSDGVKEAIHSFKRYYYQPECYVPHAPIHFQTSPMGTIVRIMNGNISSTLPELSKMTAKASLIKNLTSVEVLDKHGRPALGLNNLGGETMTFPSRCNRESCILFLFLMLGTLWLANLMNQFNRTPYFSSRHREVLKDYSLAISVIVFSFVGAYIFMDVRLDVFEFGQFTGLKLAQLDTLTLPSIALASLVGLMLAILFYVDQNICGAMVNNAPFKLAKGNYLHLDLIVLAILNAFFSIVGMPWMHGKLPHSHLHSKALAEYEERVHEGCVSQAIVKVHETRLTGLLCSLMVGLSLFAVPYPLSYIPLPVLSGVFLYTALAEFNSNSMVERICLLATAKSIYPPDHYSRTCPRRVIRHFSAWQIAQLVLLSAVGFYPNAYVKMTFPLVVALFIPLRHKILPLFIDTKYLNILDAHNE